MEFMLYSLVSVERKQLDRENWCVECICLYQKYILWHSIDWLLEFHLTAAAVVAIAAGIAHASDLLWNIYWVILFCFVVFINATRTIFSVILCIKPILSISHSLLEYNSHMIGDIKLIDLIEKKWKIDGIKSLIMHSIQSTLCSNFLLLQKTCSTTNKAYIKNILLFK